MMLDDNTAKTVQQLIELGRRECGDDAARVLGFLLGFCKATRAMLPSNRRDSGATIPAVAPTNPSTSTYSIRGGDR